jgi:Fic family protein
MSKVGNFIQQSAGYKAFVPDSFPPHDPVQWDNDLILLLSDANLAIGRLKEIELTVPDVDFFIFMYVRKEAALSSQIEGTQATIIDLLKVEAKIGDEVPSDVDEIRNYIAAMNHGLKRLRKLPLSLRLIREIHAELLKGVRGENRSPGEFRKTQNWIGGASIASASFVPPPATEVLRTMGDVEKFIHSKADSLPALIKAALMHAQFETVHPFLDGNGRVGRLLISFYLISEGILTQPLLYLSDFFRKHRLEYYDKLNTYRADGGIEVWSKFFLDGIRTVATDAADVALEIMRLKERDTKKVAEFGRNAKTGFRLLEKLYSMPVVDYKSVSRITGLSSKSTVNQLIDKFTASRILHEQTGQKKNRRFVYREYLNKFNR